MPLKMLFRTWAGIALGVFLLMLTHQSEPSTLFGRYSVNYFALLVVTALTLLLACGGYVFVRQKNLTLPSVSTRWYAPFILAIASLALVGWWFVPLTTYLPALALFRLYIALLIVAGAMVALSQVHHVPRLPNALVMVGGVVLVAVCGVAFVGHVPTSQYYDEPMIANWSVTWFTSGSPNAIGFMPLRTLVGVYANGGFYPLGAWLETLGVSLSNGRWGALLLTWSALPFIYFTAKRWYGAVGALFALFIGALLAIGESYVRSDGVVALGLAVAIWAYARAEERPIWHLLVGLALASTIEGHQLGLRFGVAFGAWYVWQYAQSIRQGRWLYRPFWYMAIGSAVYGAVYLALRLYWLQTDLNGYVQAFQQAYELETQIGGTTAGIDRIWRMIQLWFTGLILYTPVEMVLVAFGAWRWLNDRHRHTGLLLFWLAVSMLAMIAMSPKLPPYYYVHQLPIVALLGASWVATLQHWARWGAVVLVTVLLIASYALIAQDGGVDDLIHVSEAIDTLLPPEVRVVVGQQIYYFGLGDREFYDIGTFSKDAVERVLQDTDMPAPQAILFTRGLNETTTIEAYITEQAMERVRCYPIKTQGVRVDVYVLPELLPTIREEGCTS